MPSRVEKLAKDIRALRIQGARNIAKSAVLGLNYAVEDSKAKNIEGLKADMIKAVFALSAARPTEPMLRNYLGKSIAFAGAEASVLKIGEVAKFKRIMLQKNLQMVRGMDADLEKLKRHGSALLADGMTIVTHCHSSTVTGVIISAHTQGKKLKVFACETRPRFQGRLTASELAKAGVDVTLSVDMGVDRHLKKADIVLVGADAITATGDLINKVGTSALAHLAQMHEVSFFSCAETYKYDPLTRYGVREKIEERSAAEVWDKPARRVKISNPAFDATAARYINGYITEVGMVPPSAIAEAALKKIKGGNDDEQ
jgi:ribose 1,5-bisphosphate isomerase